MRGSIRKRCQCRDADGRRVNDCRKAHGSWGFRLDAGYDRATGQRQQVERSGYRTRREAEDELNAEMARVNQGTWTDDKGTSLGQWLDQWLDELAPKRSPKTMSNYRGHVRDVWKPALGRVRLRDLRRAQIERVLADLGRPQAVAGDRPEGNVGRRVEQRSPGTLDGYRRTLRSALSTAVRRGILTTNPAQGQMDAIPEREYDDELVIWEPEQTARFLQHVVNDRLAVLYELAAYAGLRRAELCGLRWQDVDLEGTAGVTIRQTVVEVSRKDMSEAQRRCPICGQEHRRRMIKRPKSRSGRRWVPLAQPARDALLAHQAQQQLERQDFGPDFNDHDLVFAMPDGIPLRPGAVTRSFESHVAACGLPRIRLHDSRHGACSLLLAGGVPLDLVQMILGHSSPAVTRKVYAHVLRGATSDLVNDATQLLTRHRTGPIDT